MRGVRLYDKLRISVELNIIKTKYLRLIVPHLSWAVISVHDTYNFPWNAWLNDSSYRVMIVEHR